MKIIKSFFSFSLLVSASLFANAQAAAHLKHHHPLPLSLCSIKAGVTKDSAVVALFGEGLFDKDAGHGGARYYTDETKKIIFRSVIGTDNVIEEVGVCSAKLPFDFIINKTISIPVSKKLNPASIMMGNIKIGDPKEKVVLQFGKPNKDETLNGITSLTYEDTHDEWKEIAIGYTATFEFKENRLERIKLYNGE